MGAIETRTFRSGNSVAVRLPKSLGYEAGMPVTIERIGDTVTMKPAIDAAAEKQKLTKLIARIRDIWGDTPRPPFDPDAERIVFPDRPGL